MDKFDNLGPEDEWVLRDYLLVDPADPYVTNSGRFTERQIAAFNQARERVGSLRVWIRKSSYVMWLREQQDG